MFVHEHVPGRETAKRKKQEGNTHSSSFGTKRKATAKACPSSAPMTNQPRSTRRRASHRNKRSHPSDRRPWSTQPPNQFNSITETNVCREPRSRRQTPGGNFTHLLGPSERRVVRFQPVKRQGSFISCKPLPLPLRPHVYETHVTPKKPNQTAVLARPHLALPEKIKPDLCTTGPHHANKKTARNVSAIFHKTNSIDQ